MEILAYIVNWKPRKLNLGGKDMSKWAESDLAERLKRLAEAVNTGWQAVDDLKSNKPIPSELGSKIANLQRPLYIFASPEYLFRKNMSYWSDQGSWKEHFYTAEDKEVYVSTLGALSKARDCGDVLFAAGTFFWAAPQASAEPLVSELKKKYTGRLETKWATKRPEHATTNLAQIEQTNTEYFGFNEALVFYNGGLRKTVAKAKDAGDFNLGIGGTQPKVKLIPGMGAGTFSLDAGEAKLKVGVSICADYNRIAEYEKTVDLLFLLSHSINAEIVKAGTIRPGGVMVYSDGIEYNQVIRGPSISEENDKFKADVQAEHSSTKGGQLLAVRCLITVGSRTS
jgi:hypothetical protein